MSRTVRYALLLLVVVLVATAAYAFPTTVGIGRLAIWTAEVFGVLLIALLLIALLRGKRPRGYAIALVLTAAGVVYLAWPQISATMDARSLKNEIAEAGRDGVAEAIAGSQTRVAGLIREIVMVADAANAEIDALIAAIADDPAIVGALDTPRVLNASSLAEAGAAIEERLAGINAVKQEINRIKDEERAALDARAIDLPDQARNALLRVARRQIETERTAFLALADIEAGRLRELGGMAAFAATRIGDYDFFAAEARARFNGASVDGEYLGYISRLRNLSVEEARIREEIDAAETDGILAMVNAADTPP